jgi:hypothetical protein
LTLFPTAGHVLDAILGVVGGNAQQPSGQLGFAAERVDALEDRDKDFLGDVLSFGALADHAQDQIEDAVAMQAHHLIEGFLVPSDQPGNQESLGQTHLKRRPRVRGTQPTGVG